MTLIATSDPMHSGTNRSLQTGGASLAAQTVKSPPAMRETRVRSLGWEDPLEKERLPTPVFLPGEFHGQRSLAGCGPRGRKSGTGGYAFYSCKLCSPREATRGGLLRPKQHRAKPAVRAPSFRHDACAIHGDVKTGGRQGDPSFHHP